MNAFPFNDIKWLKAQANLLYAIMCCDNNIHHEEKVVIRDFVEKSGPTFSELSQKEKDCIYTEIKRLIEKEESAQSSFEYFQNYYSKNKDRFTNEVKLDLLKIVDKIGSSFRAKNKSELVILQRLQTLFSN